MIKCNILWEHRDDAYFERFYDWMSILFSPEEVQSLFIERLWIESHKNNWCRLPNVQGALFARRKSTLKDFPEIKVEDALFMYAVYDNVPTTLSPSDVFESWKAKNPILNDALVVEKIAKIMTIPTNRQFWDDGDNTNITRFFAWYNKSLGPLTCHYVLSMEYFEDFEDNRYDFQFQSATLEFKPDDVLTFGARLNVQRSPGYAFSYVSGNLVLKVNNVDVIV